MFIHRLFYLLMILTLSLSAGCAPQSAIESTATPALPATSLPSPLPTLAATESPTDSPNPFAGNKVWIAYQTDRNGESIWLIHPDGTEDHQIAEDFEGHLQLPDWSPDGKKIVMTSRDTGGTEPLYEYDLASETLKQLFPCSDPCVGDDEPVYSPDGTKVAFIRALGPFVHSDIEGDDVPSNCGLWIGELSTGKLAQITGKDQPCDQREISPHWSPDASKIAYFRERYNESGVTDAIFSVDVSGGQEQQLTDWDLAAGYPDWSPDGKWIVFATHPLFSFNFDAVISNLYRMRPDGSAIEQLTFYKTPEVRANQPHYTPDGKWILFTAVTQSNRSLWAIPSDGGEPIVIAKGGIYTHGTWQP
jgi:Tol biopolymer transport system component